MRNELTAISPIDGRYASKTANLSPYFSEYALIRYRIRVEIEYFIALSGQIPELPPFDEAQQDTLRRIYLNFNEDDAKAVKKIESKTNHDVKAVEYFIKENITDSEIRKHIEFIHFGITSQDINNTAIPLMIKEANEGVYIPILNETVNAMRNLSIQTKDITMLARTHGQPASPTKMGKEIKVFVERLQHQISYFAWIPNAAKFGGATGNFNAHHVAYPNIDWKNFANFFVNRVLGLNRSLTTTQIEHYDHLAALFHNYSRINTILLDFCKDIWQYISMEYFKQKINKDEVGSSTMPHKVNPIDFENAEGNLGLANALFDHIAGKLPVSRLQRDLSDSTVLRNVGVPVAYTLIALEAIKKGISRLVVNESAIADDLNENWLVVSEGIQTVLRREGYDHPYEALKELTRTNQKVSKKEIDNFIDGLKVSDKVKAELKRISPENYFGI
ncbi:MAG: adenylosuccinate lyase [Chitinophagales bacterium]|nr:adenylosuccinate lyase [Chitinophagales bacterium]